MNLSVASQAVVLDFESGIFEDNTVATANPHSIPAAWDVFYVDAEKS